LIKNERQLALSKSELAEFRRTLSSLERKSLPRSPIEDIELQSIRNQVQALESEIGEYESLWGSATEIPALRFFEEIPNALVRARISLGLTQRDLAERIGVAEQQIQRYESEGYQSASIGRIRELIRALGLTPPHSLEEAASNITVGELMRKLQDVGLEPAFVMNRLLPSDLATELGSKARSERANELGIKVANVVGPIFRWDSNEVLSRSPLALDSTSLGSVQFKARSNVNRTRMNAQAFYAHYLALLTLQASEELPLTQLPDQPYRIHEHISKLPGSLSLENCIRFVWSLGVPVLPLNEPVGMQGAHFRERTRDILILNSRTDSPARWLFDLFHEYWHAAKHQVQPAEQALVMEDLDSASKIKVGDEHEANLFAAAVLLGANPSKVVRECVENAGRDMLMLKKSVEDVARRRDIPVDLLANVVAFRLSEDGKNWWGTARNLERSVPGIQQIAARILVKYIDPTKISVPDLNLLGRALGLQELR
jgi:Zn-dependent peptidase ImmA (M78 family)/transcriptional regulator with XRE-family HTH domain